MRPTVKQPLASLIAVAVAALLLLCSFSPKAEPVWHWQGEFSQAEQNKLTRWITLTLAALETQVASLPFDVHIHFYRLDDRGEPVPWANTRRGYRQGVNFHVDPEYSLNDFLQDWTAPHELSHLLLPYVGKQHAWFSEGFASYMQYQVMQQLGVLSATQAQAKYTTRLNRAERQYQQVAQLKQMPFIKAAPHLRQMGKYPAMYWGGASYFLQIDQQLRSQQQSLIGVIKRYVGCCRRNNDRLDKLVAQLDQISGTTQFSETQHRFATTNGFPQYQGLVATP